EPSTVADAAPRFNFLERRTIAVQAPMPLRRKGLTTLHLLCSDARAVVHQRRKERPMVRLGRSRAVRPDATSAVLLSAVSLVVLTVSSASAQTATGGLRGFVKDDTGAVLVGVTVEAASPARIGGAAVDVTDAQGLYRFENLPPGEYAVMYSLQGFASVRREGIRVEVGRTIQVDATMKVGAVEQAITVTGESPVVDALHAGVTSNFNKDWLQTVPTARQSYFDVVTYAPSVKINQGPNDSRFVIFGSSSDQN